MTARLQQASESIGVVRMHDYVEGSEPVRSLIRAPRKEELISQLLDAVDRFLSATRLERREAEANLLRVSDRVKSRLGNLPEENS